MEQNQDASYQVHGSTILYMYMHNNYMYIGMCLNGSLPLPLPDLLLDCFGSFTGLETLLDSEWYYCAGCKSRQPSTKQLSLHTLPNVS